MNRIFYHFQPLFDLQNHLFERFHLYSHQQGIQMIHNRPLTVIQVKNQDVTSHINLNYLHF